MKRYLKFNTEKQAQAATSAITLAAISTQDRVRPKPYIVAADGVYLPKVADSLLANVKDYTVVELEAAPVSLAPLKALQAKRDAVQYGAFAYMGKRIQYDINSRTNIAQASRNAMVATDEQWPANFAWRCADNTWLPLTRVQVIEMDAVAGQFLAACFAVFAQKAALLEAGQDCQLDQGWPV